MVVQLKIGAWKRRDGKKAVINRKDIGGSYPWLDDGNGKSYAPDGRYSISGICPELDIIGPWVDEPGPGYRLATEADVGREDVEFLVREGLWSVPDKLSKVHANKFVCGFNKYDAARVPVSPQFVPGEWYSVGGEKQCYVGCNPVNGKHIFSEEDGAMYAVEKVNSITPWTEPPAFRLCTGVVDGERLELCRPSGGNWFVGKTGGIYHQSRVTDIRWHEDSN